MSHQDDGCQNVRLQASFLRQALRWLLGSACWKTILFRRDCTWTPLHLVSAALLWAWADESTLDERFHTARKITEHLYTPQQELATSYQAFLKLLRRWTGSLGAVLQAHLRQRMQMTLAEHWCVFGFALFGVDGSRVELPRTRSHEAAYCTSIGVLAGASGGESRRTPQRMPRRGVRRKCG